AFSRVSQQDLEIGTVNLESVVVTVLAHLEKEIQQRGARVEMAGPWPAVVAHAPSLGQALINLVSNALKFVPPGTQPVVRVRAEEFSVSPKSPSSVGKSALEGVSARTGDWVRVWVEDNGIGIALEHQG